MRPRQNCSTFHVDIRSVRESWRDRIHEIWCRNSRRAVMGSAATVLEKRPSAMCWRQRPLPPRASRAITSHMKPLTDLIARLSPPAFWLCVMLILYLSLVPGTMRPHTGASGHLEHFFAYAMTGAIFPPGARGRMSVLMAAVGLCWLSGAVEIAQLWIPGRTGEVAGFVWSSAGAWIGLILGHWMWRTMRHLTPLEN